MPTTRTALLTALLFLTAGAPVIAQGDPGPRNTYGRDKLGGMKGEEFEICIADKDLEYSIMNSKYQAAKQLEVLGSFLEQQAAEYGTLDERAWTDLAHALFNMKDFVYLN